jgi:hypothetical protein
MHFMSYIQIQHIKMGVPNGFLLVIKSYHNTEFLFHNTFTR